MRSPIFELMRMKAAETKASRAMADWTPLAVVWRSLTTAEIDTFMNDVSTTRTNIAAASRSASRGFARSRPARIFGLHTHADFACRMPWGSFSFG